MSEDKKQRTSLQNASLHLYCKKLAKNLNEVGFDQVKFFENTKDGFELSWTMESIKHIFRKVSTALYPDVESTADLTTIQIQNVYDHIDKRFSELSGIHVEWPSKEAQFNEAMRRAA